MKKLLFIIKTKCNYLTNDITFVILSCQTKQLAANELPILNAKYEEDLDTGTTKTEKLTKFVHPLSISEDEEDDDGSEKCDATKDDDSGLETEKECKKPEDKTANTATGVNNKYV